MRRRANSKLSVNTTASFSDIPSMEYANSSHSRESSNGSDNYSPLTPTFSAREHIRMPSSSSSLASTPPSFEHLDSPSAAGKPVLHDLVEDPSERDDGQHEAHNMRKLSNCSSCQADTPSKFVVGRPSLDYDLADGFCSESDLSLHMNKKRRGSEDSGSPVSNLASRMVNRFPSLSRRIADRRSTIAINTQGVRSAPISRAPSFRLPSLTKSLVSHLEGNDPVSPPHTPIEPLRESLHIDTTAALDIPSNHLEDPIDRRALASTPLLPPLITERRDSELGSLQSPLQSPTVAERFAVRDDDLTPLAHPMPTPPLSSRPSVADFGLSSPPLSELPSMAQLDADDKWARKLGHANFSIFPEPYLPSNFDKSTCKQLTEDWETARRHYLNHAAHITEHYGPTSQTFKFTELKWSEIDAQWKKNHEIAISEATAKGEEPVNHPLADSAPLAKMPTIDGPAGKFPALDRAEIVGPMVQYAKVHNRSSKRSAFFKFFSEIKNTASMRQ